VHLCGAIDRERALAVVPACDLCVRPSRADGDALSGRVALALGRPVVASAVGARPAGTVTFPAGDAAACAEQIFHVVGKRHARGDLSTTSVWDCIPPILAIYGSCGLAAVEGTIGTPLATVSEHVRHRGSGQSARSGGSDGALPYDRGDLPPRP
jgi:hypothetical protein